MRLLLFRQKYFLTFLCLKIFWQKGFRLIPPWLFLFQLKSLSRHFRNNKRRCRNRQKVFGFKIRHIRKWENRNFFFLFLQETFWCFVAEKKKNLKSVILKDFWHRREKGSLWLSWQRMGIPDIPVWHYTTNRKIWQGFWNSKA